MYSFSHNTEYHKLCTHIAIHNQPNYKFWKAELARTHTYTKRLQR